MSELQKHEGNDGVRHHELTRTEMVVALLSGTKIYACNAQTGAKRNDAVFVTGVNDCIQTTTQDF